MHPKKPLIPKFADANIFIIESLSEGDEEHNRQSGQILSSVLRLAGKNISYYYFRKCQELQPLADLFVASKCRYLHVSMHGNISSLGIGNDHSITYEDFLTPFADYLKGKRIFFDSCLTGNNNFSDTAFKICKGLVSFTAPCEEISFDVGIAFWTSFYVRMFKNNPERMLNADIKITLDKLCNVFQTSMHFAASAKSGPTTFTFPRKVCS